MQVFIDFPVYVLTIFVKVSLLLDLEFSWREKKRPNASVRNANVNKIVDLWCHLVALGHFGGSPSDSARAIKSEALGVAL